MKKLLLLATSAFAVISGLNAQVILNEIYTSPGGGKHEFFELFNSGTENTPSSVDGFSVVTYFEEGSSKGFYVLDLPSLFIQPRGFLVGSSSIPFNYQGTTNSTSSNFSWNASSLTSNFGYMKKWVMTGNNASDGNLYYNESVVPVDFNDFFYDKSSGGANYSIFVFRNGILINSFYGGSSSSSQPSFITSMPDLNVTSVTTASSTPFTIKFGSFTANMAEFVTPSAGTDNGYIRTKDGVCNTWKKSSSSDNHTPGITNGSSSGTAGNVTITGSITRAIPPATSSTVQFDITAAASTAFPVELQVYTDNGAVPGDLDALDTYVSSVTQTSLADDYATVSFTPATANIIVVAKTAAGCFGQVKSITGGANSTLPVKLVSFAGTIKDNSAKLSWIIDMNETAESFVVEKSVNGSKFSAIGTVENINQPGRQHYTFDDALRGEEKIAYRLLMTDKDHRSEYSKVILLSSRNGQQASMTLLQNPVVGKLDINFSSNLMQTVVVRIIDVTGAIKLVQKINVQPGANLLQVQLPSLMASGTHVVSVSYAGGMFNERFIRQ